MHDEYWCDGWACTDCLLAIANGEAPADLGEDDLADWQRRFDDGTDGYRITPGMLREDHACATNWTVTYLMRHEVRGSLRRGTVDVRADSYGDALDIAWWEIPPGAWTTVARAHDLATRGDLGGDCECETRTYSSSSCDVCQTGTHGERHAVSFWKIRGRVTADPVVFGPAY